MTRCWFLLLFLLVSGCANHYHQIKGESLYLYLQVPTASRVNFATSLDGFKIHKAEKVGRKTWEAKVRAGKEFKYFYFVDGQIHVPDCRLKEVDDFGMKNCIYEPGM